MTFVKKLIALQNFKMQSYTRDKIDRWNHITPLMFRSFDADY